MQKTRMVTIVFRLDLKLSLIYLKKFYLSKFPNIVSFEKMMMMLMVMMMMMMMMMIF